jgi:glycosidase
MIDEMHKNGIRVILDGVRKSPKDFLPQISMSYLFRYTIILIVHHH